MTARLRPRTLVGAAVFTLLYGYSWMATSAEPFTWPMRVVVALPAVTMLAFAVSHGLHRRSAGRRPGPFTTVAVAGLAVWTALWGAFAAFQLSLYLSSPRQVYPTLSSLLNELFELHPARAAGFALWVALGWYLIRR